MTAPALHPNTGQLRKGLQGSLSLAGSWEGTLYRATTVEYANRHDFLSGVGSRKTGGRWNPPGQFKAVYGCLEPETAMAESLANFRDFGIPESEAMPLVFVAAAVKLQVVLDLTMPEVQNRLGITFRRMTTTDWQKLQAAGKEAVTQALGRLAWEERLEGILVPSARLKRSTNIVLFPSRRRRGSSWRIVRARNLPKKPSD